MNNYNNLNEQNMVCSVDPLIFTLINEKLHILLIKRDVEPFKDKLTLPGGIIINSDVDLEASVKRVLLNKAGVNINYIEQLKSYAGMRDPRGFTLTVTYLALVNLSNNKLPDNTIWIDVKSLQRNDLGFHHFDIIQDGIERLKSKVNYSTLPIHFLENEFTLPELQKVYEILLEQKLDKSSFRKKILETGLIEIINEKEKKNGAVRPSKLYKLVIPKSLFNFNSNIK